ncbi:DUF2147 domain-containing protein [Rhodoblastus sp.]|uniref:DUF2147 domain-containing protein n=1 Tax=Rhodoblastus sp. TaxID=1962975 RepID=UPI003F943ED5
MKKLRLALLGLMVAQASAAAAGDILGNWERVDGKSGIRMSPCGDAVCGHITSVRDANSPAKVGQRVFFGLKPSGNGWSGEAFNPDDGKTYSGNVTVAGSSMTTKGCVLGGLVCKSVDWKRSN